MTTKVQAPSALMIVELMRGDSFGLFMGSTFVLDANQHVAAFLSASLEESDRWVPPITHLLYPVFSPQIFVQQQYLIDVRSPGHSVTHVA